MKESSQSEKRREERYPQNLAVVVQELPDSETAMPYTPTYVSGRIQNISRNGICLATPAPIRLLSVIRCEIPVSDSDIPIATLMRVRWIRKYDQIEGGFLSGIEAIL